VLTFISRGDNMLMDAEETFIGTIKVYGRAPAGTAEATCR
jgi:hypothetical protein